MAIHRRKTLRKILATVSVLFLTVLFCVSPCAVSRVYAAGSSELSTQAVLSKSNFGTVKKINNAYYIVDEFGNIIDTVSPTAGIDLDRHIGKQILVKDNLFAGLMESRPAQRNTFLGRLREYLSGIVPKPKIVLPKPKPGPVEPPIGIIVPMYGVQPPYDEIIIKPIPDPEKPPIDIIVPMYGVQPPIDEIIIGPKDPDPEKPPIDIIVPMYGVQPPVDEIIIKPISDPEKPEPIKEALPLRGEPTIRPAAEQMKEQSDKMDVVQKQGADRAELAEKNIKVIPEPSQKKDILNQKKE